MSDTIRITGGKPLTGEITVRGAKNFVSKAMVAALLGDGPSILHNMPDIRDVSVVTALLELYGATAGAVTKTSNSEASCACTRTANTTASNSRCAVTT